MIKDYSVIRDSDGVCVNVVRWDADAELDYNYSDGYTVSELKPSYSVGSGSVSVTNGSISVTVADAAFITAGIEVGRRIHLGDSDTVFVIAGITSETELTINAAYDGTTSTTADYGISSIQIGNVIP